MSTKTPMKKPSGDLPEECPAAPDVMNWERWFLVAKLDGIRVTMGMIRALVGSSLATWPLAFLGAAIKAGIDIEKWCELECMLRFLESETLIDVGIYVSRTGLTFVEGHDCEFLCRCDARRILPITRKESPCL